MISVDFAMILLLRVEAAKSEKMNLGTTLAGDAARNAMCSIFDSTSFAKSMN